MSEFRSKADVAKGLYCQSKHFTCKSCLDAYVLQRSAFATTSENESLMRRDGHILCPLASDPASPNPMLTCTCSGFSDQRLAAVLSHESYTAFIKGQHKVVDNKSFAAIMAKHGGDRNKDQQDQRALHRPQSANDHNGGEKKSEGGKAAPAASSAPVAPAAAPIMAKHGGDRNKGQQGQRAPHHPQSANDQNDGSCIIV